MRAAAAPRRAPAVAPARALARRRCRARRAAALAVAAPEAFEVPVRLNTTPHSRSTRQLFYADVVASFAAAVADGVPRGRLWCEWTELNTETDVYRVGTLLELVRCMATEVATAQGRNVRVVVQGSMGRGVFQGLPLQLSGVRRLLDMMEWDEVDGVELVAGDVPRVRIGALDADELLPDDHVVIVIAPQNIKGAAIMPALEALVERAEAQGTQVFLLNDKLADIPSAEGLMGVRGRAERREYAASFEEIYHFRLVYNKPLFHPIYGALRRAHDHDWQVYKRFNVTKRTEEYRVIKTFPQKPTREELSDAILRYKPPPKE